MGDRGAAFKSTIVEVSTMKQWERKCRRSVQLML